DADPVDGHQVAEQAAAAGEELRPMVADVAAELHDLRRSGKAILYEGAQGGLLDVDHGAYHCVPASIPTRGPVGTGADVAPRVTECVLGITKAYTTRVGAGPFPTELHDEEGQRMAEVGVEFGATTGRARRCGWLDAVALRRMVGVNGVTGLCITKLDVLDGFDRVRVCVKYEGIDGFPVGAEEWARARPVYEDIPGWQGSTRGLTDHDRLPSGARAYLDRIEE